ncbi:Ferric reductase like transmembrane component [Fragilaria crotonensis]|nr:Ferric reductase like transmembrane component [Fragilaria crotonensis]
MDPSQPPPYILQSNNATDWTREVPSRATTQGARDGPVDPSPVVIIFGIIVIVVMTLPLCCQLARRLRQTPTTPYTPNERWKSDDPEVTNAKINSHIERYAMVLDESVFNQGHTDNTDASVNQTKAAITADEEDPPPSLIDDNDVDISMLSERLAQGSISVDLRTVPSSLPGCERREISDSCAVCISLYRPADKVVWSSNPECKHVFHSACIEEWLRKERSHLRCPCCRHPFLADVSPDLEKGSL